LIEEKKHVKIIEHENLHFNCEIGKIEQLDGCECRRETIRDGKKMKRGQQRLEQLNRLPTEKTKMLK
jgi:hypothetical protein